MLPGPEFEIVSFRLEFHCPHDELVDPVAIKIAHGKIRSGHHGASAASVYRLAHRTYVIICLYQVKLDISNRCDATAHGSDVAASHRESRRLASEKCQSRGWG